MHVKQYSSLGEAIFDRLGNSGRKDPDTMLTRKKRSGSETSVFERSTFEFGNLFKKVGFGARAFSKSSGYVRIVSQCDSFYISGVEKLRFRKDPGTCALA